MKKHLLLFLVVLVLFITPLYANTTKTIYLNDFLYQPIHKVLSKDDTTYISLEDLNQLTYSSYTQTDNSLVIDFNGTTIKTDIDSRLLKVGNTTFTLSSPIALINDVIYIPTQFFTVLNYTYAENDASLSFTSPTPYSTTTDSYKGHTKISAGDTNLADLVKDASTTPEEGEILLKDAIKNNRYLVLPFKSPSPQLLNALRTNLKSSKPMEIVVRKADFLSKTPSISTLETVPITPLLDGEKLSIKINATTLTSTFFELAFNPSDDTNLIDSDKTFDAILTRLIYSYYRDYYHLKDDVHFSPVSTIEMKRSDAMHFKVYLNEVMDTVPSSYEMIISKQMHADRISYLVDFVKLS
nr:stalk domain-containing protein [uncultured Cellulosilyticum sp.]